VVGVARDIGSGADRDLGLPAVLFNTRVIRNLLFELVPHDPLIITLASFVRLCVAITAGCFPARRTAKGDPMVALRYE